MKIIQLDSKREIFECNLTACLKAREFDGCDSVCSACGFSNVCSNQSLAEA